MTRLHILALLVTGSMLVGSGCASQILSPPARFQALDGLSTAAPDDTWLDFEGGGGGQMFGPSAYGGSLRVRHGVGDTEWSGEASLVQLNDSGASTASLVWGALRGGARGRVVEGFRHAWWGAGLGGGAYAGGIFASPEVTIGAGYDNPYIVPYLSITGFMSLPIVARTVDTTDDADVPSQDSPLATFGVRFQVGFDVPITDFAKLAMGVNLVTLVDVEGVSEGWGGFGGALKFRL